MYTFTKLPAIGKVNIFSGTQLFLFSFQIYIHLHFPHFPNGAWEHCANPLFRHMMDIYPRKNGSEGFKFLDFSILFFLVFTVFIIDLEGVGTLFPTHPESIYVPH